MHRILRFPRLFALLFGAAVAYTGTAQFDGFALYNNQNQSTAYLINAAGQIAHSWSLPTNANYAMALKPNGNIVRGAVNTGNVLTAAAVGGKIQEFTPSGQLVWEFVYSTSSYVTHHDICLMPNGNVLMIAYNVRTNAQLQALGYTGTSAKWPDRIIEVQQNGTGGQIVWQWDLIDRFIQYVDAAKPNYMPIADHPERLNINVAISGANPPGSGGDWFHLNGIDYNPALDQIAFSSRLLSEIFIIDHSTTTAEAAGHTAGNSGMGGDFLFRWGKPANYGTAGTQTIPAACHDVRWILDGRPNAGYLQFVNNGGGTGSSTVIDAINPTRNGYTYPRTAGTAYGPTAYEWRHNCLASSTGQSASDRMPNGNTFVAISGEYMYEVSSAGSVVWQYNAGPQKAFRYTCDYPGIAAILGADPCDIGTGVADRTAASVGLFPNPTNGAITITGVSASDVKAITVLDAAGREVLRDANTLRLDLGAQPEGLYNLVIDLASGQRLHKKVAVAMGR
ncbi:MAG: aryl-sulfate sulfotransferase [Flavobacteriales bacterium]|nr:aryl-sulfate sulfotransferase [Flavobacteriales bacterium]MCC6937806.1 aryl-sulfate sulfotransferase [Flavobacteriales bacterium]